MGAMTISYGTLLAAILLLIAPCAEAGLPPGVVWERVDLKKGHQANDLVETAGAVVAVGNEGAIWRTVDRENWTVEKSGTTDALFGIAKGNGVLVTVGASGRILRSSAAGVWTSEVSGVSVNLESVVYGGGIFVAAGKGGKVVSSTDGRKRVPWVTGVTKNLHDVTWDGTSFLVVGDAATALSAPPGGAFAPLANTPVINTNFELIAAGSSGSVIDPGFFKTALSEWTWRDDVNFNDVTIGAGVFVGVSDAGVISASDNGRQWTQVLTTSLENFRSVIWTGAEFIAVTDSGRLATSPNGYRWKTLGLYRHYSSGCWDGSQYVLIGYSGSIATSSDAKWWTAERNPRTNNLTGVASGGGRLVAVGEEGCILSSPDGRDWQNETLPCTWSLLDVHWSGSAFWAVGSDGIILTSVNGMDWTISAPGLMSAAVWDGSRYLAFSGKNVIQSLDGNHWTPVATTNAELQINDLLWTGSYYIAAGNSTALLRSTDGITWTKATFNGAVNITTYVSLAFSGSTLVALGDGGYHARSTDGMTWTTYPSGYTGFKDVLWDGTRFLAVGLYGVYQSSDGIAWQSVYSTGGFQFFLSIAWNGSKYLAAGSTISPSGGLVFSSSNGVTWTPVSTGAGSSYIDVECEPGGDAVAISSTGAIQRYRNNTWSVESSGLVGNARGLILGAGGFLALSENAMASESPQEGVWNVGNRRDTAELLRAVTSGNGRLVMIAASTSTSFRVVSSVNGVDWSSEPLAANVGISSRTRGIWTGAQFAFVIGSSVWTSATGVGWTNLGSAPDCDGLYDIEYFNGNLVLAGRASSQGGSGIWNVTNGVIQPGAAWFDNFHSLVSDGSRILAYGPYPSSFSNDAVTWTKGEYGPTVSRSINDVIHTPMGFFAVDGELLKSMDGRSWSKVATNLDSMPASAMVYAEGRIVTVGSNGLASSTDGSNWNFTPKSHFYRDMAWGNGRYVAVSGGATASSTDGITWQFANQIFALDSVVWTGMEFLATHTSGAVLTSDDGLAWRYRVIPGKITGYAYGNGTHLVATSIGEVFKSPDLLNWTRVFKSGSGLVRVVYAGSHFFLFGSQTYKSTDAITWTALTRTYQDMVWTGSQYVGVGNSGVIGLSTDATTWAQKATTTSQPLRAAVWTGDRIVAVGSAGAAVSSADGNTWTSLNFSTTASLIDVAWTGTDLLALAADGAILHLLPLPALPPGFSAKALFSDGNVTLIADAAGRIAKLGNEGWLESVRLTGSVLNAISNTPSGFVACGEGGNILRSNDGSAWVFHSGWNHVIGGAAATEVFQAKSVINGRLIALGTLGTILDSSDGHVWQTRAPSVAGARSPLTACVQPGADLVTVGNNGKILLFGATSGKEVLSRTKQNLLAIASAGDRLVAVGAAGVILYSGSGLDVPDCYESWIDGQGASAQSSSANDDPNQDGVANLTAYLFGLSATGTSSGAARDVLPQSVTFPEGSGIRFEILSDRDDLELIFERTLDLRGWSEISRKIGNGSWGGPAVVIEEPAISGRWGFTLIDPTSPGTTAAFYRIRQNLR